MNTSLLAAALAAVVASTLAGCDRPAGETAPQAQAPDADSAAAPAPDATAAASATPPTDFNQLAQRLVTQSAAVKEGDLVWISGRPHDAALLESIAVEVRKAGAFPTIEYSSDDLSKRLFFDVPAEYDSQANGWGAALAETADVVINLDNGTSENLFEGADPKRVAARGKANEAIGQAFVRNNVRTVDVGNNLYPTPWRAERFGMDAAALSKMFWDGVNLDYAELEARGEAVRKALAAGDTLHITHPAGTDLRLRVQGRPVLVSDGVLSDADIARGGASTSVYLPAGEVYTTPVPGSAEGTLVVPHWYYRGKAVDNLTLTFQGGQVTALSGDGPGFADMKADYDAVDDARKAQFAFFDLGINPNVALPAESRVGNWVPAGTVTVGTGNNTWAGGDNSVPHSITASLPGASVTLDDTRIVDAGELKL
ncbi:MAG: hypothetical protein A2579_06545 [Lysobacterales bacterium RIFOXYD1_FULL_69_11]|nr:MAG: hypothetical protein A2190_01990 [Xanthomonadales bacterium RIFOXYA1_FULL_69_10]OHE88547.1 MAG: hypothetical protein A2579_06545 [Xanthomonadales bacterium RIFOXYD1_FULL_69_11]